ncbi:hypothetical protein MKZ38_000843 [Zalerion maritima]|uniref:Mso1 N-terminal domain-containing protein n=1 Tax=Zalerion maritima TaxID=339359 RepID=A0AAD5RZU0_9PEZI|nr:hypothetical protein MKZ38_000843 [Zalerion maritima]
MSSWFSNALNATSKGITNLKSSLLGLEADGDTEDDTHVCRVLRGYYNEKGRPFPPWLPPDPKGAPAPVVQPPTIASSRYGGMNQSQAPATSGGGLSSLWDNNATTSQQQQAPQSLRAGRQRPGAPAFNNADSNRPNLPSQRSYGSGTTPPGTSSGGVSASEKLKARLGRGAGGARTTSPANQSAFAPPPSSQPTSGGSASRGSGGGNYEDRFAPGGTYENGGGGGGYGGSGSRSGSDKPYMSANAPWVTDSADFMGGGGMGGGGRSGLPSGPRRGLPSGPRMR